MALSPFLRKVSLTAHVTFSVGWLGAVAAFLAIAITGLVNQDTKQVQAAYITMNWVGWFVIVPACLGSLITGLIQSLGTNWGLFKYYWILVKFLLTLGSAILLFLHLQPISLLAAKATDAAVLNSDLRALRVQLIVDSGAALLVLLVITSISVFKPWGRTKFSLVKQMVALPVEKRVRSWKFYFFFGLIGLIILLFIIFHLHNGGMKHH